MDLVEKNGEIPSSVTELYDRFVDFILGREDKKKGITAVYEYIIKKKFLGRLAFTEFLQKDRLEIPRDDFNAFFTVYSQEFGFKAELHAQFLSEIERGGVMKIGEKTVAFVHRSFLDYFTAFYIYDNRDDLDEVPELIVKLWYSGLWQEVAFFFVGLKRDISSNILNRLLEMPGDGAYTDIPKFMIGRLLQAGWHSPSLIKSEGISRAFALAPVVKQHILDETEGQRHEFPKILADFFVFKFANVSYRSTFLKDELHSYYKKLHERGEPENLRIMLPLLWVIKPFLNNNELRIAINEALDIVAKLPDKAVEEEAGALLILRGIEERDTELTHTIDKRVDRFSRKHPGAFKAILPAPRKGFRQKASS